MKTIVALTGANGAFGSEVLSQLVSMDLQIRVLLRSVKKTKKFTRKILKKNADKIEIIVGDITEKEDCLKLVKGADFVVHLAGMIPPSTEHQRERAYKVNFIGTKNIVDAIAESGGTDTTYLVNIATIAEYGNRTFKHSWARVGDPLISPDYDEYSYTKILAERYVLESPLSHFVSLRQTAMAHKYLFKGNLSDGLIYQTPLNSPYEWVTDIDSGIMIAHLIDYQMKGTLESDFWNRIYNVGGGIENRCTGYETMDQGFSLLGRTLKNFTYPHWFCTRNFHGAFFYDSDVLDSYLHYKNETLEMFWKRMSKKYPYFKLGKIVPPSWLRKLLFERLTSYDDAPKYWVDRKIDGRVKAYYGGWDKYEKLPKDWKDYPLICEGKNADQTFIDYQKMKDEKYAEAYLLDHGFDESKPISELDLEDMKKAAAFRGGFCLSEEMEKGDLYTPLLWQCHKGHAFYAKPYTILFGGFWCPDCFKKPWKNGRIAKHSPYFAQVYYDDHDKEEEDDIYPPKTER